MEDATPLALKVGEGDHEPKVVGGFWKLEQLRKQMFPWSLQTSTLHTQLGLPTSELSDDQFALLEATGLWGCILAAIGN